MASSSSPSQKKFCLLTYLGTSTCADEWDLDRVPCKTWSIVGQLDKLSLTAPKTFEDVYGGKNYHHITPFDDHPEGEGVTVAPWSIPHMKMTREELPWTEIRFESWLNPIQALSLGPKKRWLIFDVAKRLNDPRAKLAISVRDCACCFAIVLTWRFSF